MRTLLLASAGIITAISGGAQAQRAPGASYPPPGANVPAPLPPANRPTASHRPAPLPAAQPSAARWGSMVDGRWWGGANAPGGWNAYRRPVRGVALPPYWVSPRFTVSDWNSYGLGEPARGRRWARYYDDAVLIDDRGTVYDTVGDIDWTGARRRDEFVRDDRRYAERAPARRDDAWRGDRRGGDGLTGAAIGAVAGGVAGNVIAGRGNRLGGTLIGAGVGAAGGYAIDRSRSRGRRAEPGYDYPVAPDYGDDYGSDYDPYYDDGYAPPPPPPVAPAVTTVQGGAPWVSPDGRTTVTTTTAGGYPAGGYYYPGTTTTTVVVQSAPVVTTTTTEVYEDRVRYTPRTVVRRKTKLLRR
ncbi:RcnB family protein [uncultured Sphingomonas sp.]|uniref:RcnB family protein n=1 Tax=uncultured Sphingomonas sp. TaxID=158754 RepID=UPI002627A7DC|nr:RcnB family protein [uncultured Sphingomonas sp.]